MMGQAKRYSPREIAATLGVHRKTVWRAIWRGELRAQQDGRQGHYWTVLEPELAAWLEYRLRK